MPNAVKGQETPQPEQTGFQTPVKWEFSMHPVLINPSVYHSFQSHMSYLLLNLQRMHACHALF